MFNGYDVVIFDWMFFCMEGLEVLRRLWLNYGVLVFVVMLVVKVVFLDKIIVFCFGVDDYVIKFFEFLEFEVCLEVLVFCMEGCVIRRWLLIGEFMLDLRMLEVIWVGK